MCRLSGLGRWVLVLSVVTTGCSGILSPREQQREKALFEATQTYEKLMRWGYFEQATQYLRAKEGEIASPDLKKMAQFKVTGYHTGEQLMSSAGDEARVLAQIDYYDIDTGVVNTARDEQYWWFDAEKRRWYLGSPMPSFVAHRR
ncbi:MAG: hypothetical protein HYX63_19825 [Gammaproteobacteria bacterium]|nr:hypothetical protein [Gammaproteobacteria bacterium]